MKRGGDVGPEIIPKCSNWAAALRYLRRLLKWCATPWGWRFTALIAKLKCFQSELLEQVALHYRKKLFCRAIGAACGDPDGRTVHDLQSLAQFILAMTKASFHRFGKQIERSWIIRNSPYSAALVVKESGGQFAHRGHTPLSSYQNAKFPSQSALRKSASSVR